MTRTRVNLNVLKKKQTLQGEEYLYETLLYRTQEIIINKDIS